MHATKHPRCSKTARLAVNKKLCNYHTEIMAPKEMRVIAEAPSACFSTVFEIIGFMYPKCIMNKYRTIKKPVFMSNGIHMAYWVSSLRKRLQRAQKETQRTHVEAPLTPKCSTHDTGLAGCANRAKLRPQKRPISIKDHEMTQKRGYMFDSGIN